jgi:hypothetical protein
VLWAKALIVGGLLLVGATFAVSTGDLHLAHRPHASAQHGDGCANLIPASWLVAGTAGAPARPARTPAQRRAAARCAAIVHRDRMVMWGVLGLGGLAVLVGWTALRERNGPAYRPALVTTA